MKAKPKSVVILHAAGLLYSVLVLLWMLLPLASKAEGLMPVPYLPFRAFDGSPRAGVLVILWSVAVYLPVFVALFKIAALFLEEAIPALANPGRPLSALLSVL